ncbi:putative disease resistance RPP13-like protein 1 [Cocos nucifera]|uniref:Putative disease resistance RPP13-like protein 1 n=1 Tax=Cocos nucifera TaxID=13894 RepID=A0A8K0NAB9_COCNU|nr:putative disease resistance RPP13-like protein 1 [Cocos nucifera]
MASALLFSIRSTTSQVLGSVRRWATSPSSSSDPRSSVLEDLEQLERTLKRIHAVLHDAEEREIREEAVKLWLQELKEVGYDAEDVLDEYHYEVLRAQVEGGASRKRKRVEGDDEEQVSSSLFTTIVNVSIPDGMGDRLREIRKRFGEISEDRERLRLREEDGERRVFGAPSPPPSSHMVDESSIYGREHDKEKVIDLLFSEGMGINGISVIPIVGKGGLGKTTIAQLVYNDSKVKKYFNLIGWVCVSDDFDVTKLTKDIIESITPQSCDHRTQLSRLQDTLKENVKGKRVLLVLDDVWNEQQSHWESLRIPFVGAETVRIIVTCRNDSVAKVMQTQDPYRPDCLSPEQSWSLFKHYAFASGDPKEQPHLVDIGEQIVKKCSGLPLAVKTIGSLLRHEMDEDSWMEVLQSDLWELEKNNETLASLRLSYNRMPAHLKPCFVYCSMFPKDYAFDRDVLVRLWMAQDYIPIRGGKTMEDIGDEYFNGLLRRSFFDSYVNCLGQTRFKMHDMIHDLAKFITGNECYAIVDKKLPSSPNKVRHLYVLGEEELVKSLSPQNLWALRTLLQITLLVRQIVIPEITQFSLLRCLEFYCKEVEILDLLSNLKHLRYLYIVSHCIKKLPESICLLYHLQTLIVECHQLKELPSGIGSLTNLRHLETTGTHIRLAASIEKLTNLQRLYGCYEVQGRIGVLKNLRHQGELRISGLRNLVSIEDAKDVGLKHKHKLERLFLFWDADCKHDWHNSYNNIGLHLKVFLEENKDVPADEKREEALLEYLQPPANLKMLNISWYGGSKFPEWVGNPSSFASLKDIVIIDCEKIRSLPLCIHDSLGKLDASISKSMLERVSISGCRQLKSIGGLHNLHSLEELKISVCPQLLILSEEGLPSKLQNLHIEKCQRLTSLPGMQNLTSLEALNIENCPQLQLLSEEGLPSNLKNLYINDCQQLTSLSGMQNLTSLRALTIERCPQLRLLSEEGLPSNLRNLDINDCLQLMSLSGMQNLTSLRNLIIERCPQLRLLSEEGLPSNLENLFVNDCQQLTSLSGMQNLTSLRVLTIKRCPQLRLLSEEELPSNLKDLEINDCHQLTSLSGMQNLPSLVALTIERCPQLRLLSEEGLPSNLKNLCINDCQRLTSLSEPSLEELVIKDCLKLEIMLLQLCEAESISDLDEVAGSQKTMHLANSVALEFLDSLKNAFRKEAKQLGDSHDKSSRMGLVLLNALRLADMFSDDSFIFPIPVLAEIFAIPHAEFLSSWCSVNIPMMEEDANLEYDPFTAAGVALCTLYDGSKDIIFG